MEGEFSDYGRRLRNKSWSLMQDLVIVASVYRRRVDH